MALSLKTLRNLFPKDEPAFKPPFRVETDKDGEVHIYDAGDDVVTTFCTHTQMPLDDDRALAAEVAYWEIEAGRLAAALNIAYPSPEKEVPPTKFVYSSVMPKFKKDGSNDVDHLECWVHTTLIGQDQDELYRQAKTLSEAATAMTSSSRGSPDGS